MTEKKTKKEKITEVFEVGDKEVVKKSTEDVPTESKNQNKNNEKTLKIV